MGFQYAQYTRAEALSKELAMVRGIPAAGKSFVRPGELHPRSMCPRLAEAARKRERLMELITDGMTTSEITRACIADGLGDGFLNSALSRLITDERLRFERVGKHKCWWKV